MVMGPRRRGGAAPSAAAAPSEQPRLRPLPCTTYTAEAGAAAAAPAAAAPAAAATAKANLGSSPPAATGDADGPTTGDEAVAAEAYDSREDDDTLYDACDEVLASASVQELTALTAAAATTAATRVAWADDARQREPAGRPVRRIPGGIVDAAQAAASPAAPSGAVAPLVPVAATRTAVTTAAATPPRPARVVGPGGAALPGDKRLSPQLPLPDGVYRGCNITVVLRPTASEPLMDGSSAAAAAAAAAAGTEAATGDDAATPGARGGRRSLDAPPATGGGGGGGGSRPGGAAAADARRSCQLPDGGRLRRVRVGISSKVSSLLWRE